MFLSYQKLQKIKTVGKRDLALTGERGKGDDDSPNKDHLLICNQLSDFEDFSILTTKNNDFKVTLMEILQINKSHPPVNKNK